MEEIMPQDGMPVRRLEISPSAARRIAVVAADEGENVFMRVAVSGGGGAGFQYSVALDRELGDEDRIFERDGAKVVVDETSLDLIGGAELDYVEELGASFFQMRNPNAASSCGCGMSFSV